MGVVDVMGKFQIEIGKIWIEKNWIILGIRELFWKNHIQTCIRTWKKSKCDHIWNRTKICRIVSIYDKFVDEFEKFQFNALIMDYISEFLWLKLKNLANGLVMRCIFHFIYLYNV